jgi:hypothetical protein
LATRAELTEALRRRAGNLDVNDPIYTGSNSLVNYVNDGQNFMILRALRSDRGRFSNFPGLRDRWIATTSQLDSSMDLPGAGTSGAAIAIDNIYSFDVPDTSPQPDENLVQRRKLEWIEPEDWEKRSRSATPTGWPNAWTRIGNTIYTYPTAGAGYATWIIATGLKGCPELGSAGSVPIFSSIWNQAHQDASAYLLFKDLDWQDEAKFALAALDTNIQNAEGIRGTERGQKVRRVRFRGMPR